MPSEFQSADSHEYQSFPRITERIGENPARFLDRDLLASTPEGQSQSLLMVEARIRGIDFLDVCIAYLAVETQLERDDCPRQGVLRRLEARKEWLKENGDRPRGKQYDHDAIDSTKSIVKWATESGEQRTGATVQ